MDPVMRAARVFLAEADALWRERPERALPLVADPSERGEVVKALRLGELAPENRRPLFLYEAPFAEPAAYFDGFTRGIERDYDAVRKGVAEEGVELPPFSMNPIALGPSERAALAMERAAVLLGERFEGATFALVPEQVGSGPAWRESVRALDRMGRSPRVRLAVYAPPGGPLNGTLGEEGAQFRLDGDELAAFFAERAEPEDPPGVAVGPRLRALLLAAAASATAGKHATAARRYHEAAALCASEGLVLEEAMARMGHGGACLPMEAPDLAAESYTKAAELAKGENAWALACQAWLGAGGAYILQDAHALAAVAYRAAADAAKQAAVPPLLVQALRMRCACLRRLGRDDEAAAEWPDAAPFADADSDRGPRIESEDEA